jgi:hypothetical protein
MDVGDIVSKGYLEEQGFEQIFAKGVGKLDEVFVYHHEEKQLEVKIERYYASPEIYTVMNKWDLKQLNKT